MQRVRDEATLASIEALLEWDEETSMPAGAVEGRSEQLAYRNRWIVEKAGFFAERARLARQVRDAQADARRAVQ